MDRLGTTLRVGRWLISAWLRSLGDLNESIETLQIDDAIDVIQFAFVVDQVVAEGRGLKELVVPFQANGAAGKQRLKTAVEFNPVGKKESRTQSHLHVAFGDRDVSGAVVALTIGLET